MHFEFQHRIAYREFNGIYKPVMTVSLERQGEDGPAVEFAMLVDTGADDIILPGRMFEFFDVDLEHCRKVWMNIGGARTEAYQLPPMWLQFPDVLPDQKFLTNPWICPDLHRDYGLLGREDSVLANVRYCFTHQVEHAFYMGS